MPKFWFGLSLNFLWDLEQDPAPSWVSVGLRIGQPAQMSQAPPSWPFQVLNLSGASSRFLVCGFFPPPLKYFSSFLALRVPSQSIDFVFDVGGIFGIDFLVPWNEL